MSFGSKQRNIVFQVEADFNLNFPNLHYNMKMITHMLKRDGLLVLAIQKTKVEFSRSKLIPV